MTRNGLYVSSNLTLPCTLEGNAESVFAVQVAVMKTVQLLTILLIGALLVVNGKGSCEWYTLA